MKNTEMIKALENLITNAQAQLESLKKEEEGTTKQLEFYRRFDSDIQTDGIEIATAASYNSHIEIKDIVFLQKRKNYNEAAAELIKHVRSKIKELESMNGSDPS
jgi:restriction endonuclease S subunit